MKTLTKKPAKKSSIKRPPSPPRRVVAAAAQDNRPRAYIFQSHKEGVPAILSVSVVATSPREAIGAAYLAADDFSEWCMKELLP